MSPEMLPKHLGHGAMSSPELSARSPERWDPRGYTRMQVKVTAFWLQRILRRAGPTLHHCTAPGESRKVPFPLPGIGLGLVFGVRRAAEGLPA